MVFDIEEVGDEGLDFNFQINKNLFEINEEGYFLNKDIEVSGRLTRMDNDVYLKGNVNTELTLKCSRCLDLLHHPVDSIIKAHFVPRNHDTTSVGEVELRGSDIDTEVFEEKRIDLTQSIRDGILLAVPVICLCAEDCKGICPQCGTRLNEEYCGCARDLSIDPRLEILKRLKNKIK